MWILMDNLLIFGSVIWWRIVKISVTSGEMEMEMAERITAVLAVFRRRLQPWSSGNPTYRGSPAVIMVYYCIFPFIWFLNLKEIAFHCVFSRLKCIAWLCYLWEILFLIYKQISFHCILSRLRVVLFTLVGQRISLLTFLLEQLVLVLVLVCGRVNLRLLFVLFWINAVTFWCWLSKKSIVV